MKRCPWAEKNELDQKYHDEEWGVPVHDDHDLFEMLTLESAQSGLSWSTILAKREGYREVFKNFDPKKVARFTPAKVEKLLEDTRIVRHRQKIESTINNAKCILKVQKEFSSFDQYIWSFVDHKPIQNKWKKMSDVPSKTELAITMSKDLKKRGFKFLGPTTCYAFMQAAGLVNDHLVSCFRYGKV